MVEGSLERSGNRVRVNAQLIDAATDTHLWAERFDREINDLFELQSEIAGRIAVTLNLELVVAEANRPVEHPDALDYIFRGREFFSGRPPTRENLQKRSIVRAGARARSTIRRGENLSRWRVGEPRQRRIYPSPAVDLARAEKLIDEALAGGTRISWAHYVKGTVLRTKGDVTMRFPSSKQHLH